MRFAKVVGVSLTFAVLTWALGAEAHRGFMELRQREAPGSSRFSVATGTDTIWYTGFEPGDSLGTNFDYNSGTSPDQWHVTKTMLYEGTSTWMIAAQDSYFCHIGDDSTGYSDGNDVGYQIQLDLTNYSDANLYYLSAMQAYSNGDFDKFAVWGWCPGLGDTLINLDPGEGYAWGGDWGPYWYPPDTPDSLISLAVFAGQADVVLEFWFYSNTGSPQGFGVGIDEILITGTPATSVEGLEESSERPQDFALDPPYPNPFNAATTITFQVPEGEVEVAIYNVCGQRVRTLFQGPVAAGSYVQSWDGRDEGGAPVESGIYFCLLRSGKVCLSRKMVLVR